MKTLKTITSLVRELRPSIRRWPECTSHPRSFSNQVTAISNSSFLHSQRQQQRYQRILRPSIPQETGHRRFSQTAASDPPSTPPTVDPSSPTPELPEHIPRYQLSFTCKPCQHRSTHEISHHGYHKGSVLVTCPNCKNRHVISDHLKMFSDKSTTIEEIMKDKGEVVKRGKVFGNGDVEFWDEDAVQGTTV